MATDGASSKAPTTAALQGMLRRLQQSLDSRSKDGPLSERWSLGRLEAGWVYAMQLRLEHGRWVVGELRVFPESDLLNWDRMKRWIAEPLDFPKIPSGGLTARQLRRIPFHQPAAALTGMMRAAKAIARSYEKLDPAFFKSLDIDPKLVRIAAAYVDLLRRHSRQPTADCAQLLGLSVSRVRDAIHQARVRKLLTGSPGQGSAGGELTPYALDLLRVDSPSLGVTPSRDATSPRARSGGRKIKRATRGPGVG